MTPRTGAVNKTLQQDAETAAASYAAASSASRPVVGAAFRTVGRTGARAALSAAFSAALLSALLTVLPAFFGPWPSQALGREAAAETARNAVPGAVPPGAAADAIIPPDAAPAAGVAAAESAAEAPDAVWSGPPPERVVSLDSSATEIVVALGAGDRLAGLAWQDSGLPGVSSKPMVGGAGAPHWDLVAALAPDLIITPPGLAEAARSAVPGAAALVWSPAGTLSEARTAVASMGRILGRGEEAEALLAADDDMLGLIAEKVAKVPPAERLRVMRVALEGGVLLTPGEDSFQTELIRAAGGIAPEFGPGVMVEVDPAQWRVFGPQLVYACGPIAELRRFLAADGWNSVEAVKNGQIHAFPCALTDRAAAHVGYFVAWLASTIYAGSFADRANLARPDERLGETPLELSVPYVSKASIVETRLMDFVHRSLVVEFARPQRVVSTVNGQRSSITAVGNAGSPTAVWSVYHLLGFERSQEDLHRSLGLDPATTDFLATGADLGNLVVKSKTSEDLTVTVLATAGVEGNALRAGRDEGAWFERPGTINIIVMADRELSDRAASRAVITVTEAKTAALWDMDVRSVQSGLANPATGTGTDDVIVVQGEGERLDYSGGHSRLGQLISEAVREAVVEAILKQNGKSPRRPAVERLAERGLTLGAILDEAGSPPGGPERTAFEALLLAPRTEAFVEAAMALSDAQVMGQLGQNEIFEAWALLVASEVAGRPLEKLEAPISSEGRPPALATALNALFTGLRAGDSEAVAAPGE